MRARYWRWAACVCGVAWWYVVWRAGGSKLRSQCTARGWRVLGARVAVSSTSRCSESVRGPRTARGEAERARVILYWLQVEVLKLTRTARWRAHRYRYRSVSCATETYVARNRCCNRIEDVQGLVSVGKKSCWPLGQRGSRGHRAWRFRASLLSQRGYRQV